MSSFVFLHCNLLSGFFSSGQFLRCVIHRSTDRFSWLWVTCITPFSGFCFQAPVVSFCSGSTAWSPRPSLSISCDPRSWCAAVWSARLTLTVPAAARSRETPAVAMHGFIFSSCCLNLLAASSGDNLAIFGVESEGFHVKWAWSGFFLGFVHAQLTVLPLRGFATVLKGCLMWPSWHRWEAVLWMSTFPAHVHEGSAAVVRGVIGSAVLWLHLPALSLAAPCPLSTSSRPEAAGRFVAVLHYCPCCFPVLTGTLVPSVTGLLTPFAQDHTLSSSLLTLLPPLPRVLTLFCHLCLHRVCFYLCITRNLLCFHILDFHVNIIKCYNILYYFV